MVYIAEFLPNPAGKDSEGEYVLLANDGDKQARLDGWSIADASGKTVMLDNRIVAPHGTLKLTYQKTKLSLNNTGETITLFNSAGNVIDVLSYDGKALDGVLIRHQKKETTESISVFNSGLREADARWARKELSSDSLSILELSLLVVVIAVVLAQTALFVVQQVRLDGDS